MSILTRHQTVTQMRCLPLHGRSDVYRYVQMVNGAWEPINHINRHATVGDMTELAGVAPCVQLTDGSPTSAESPFALSAGNRNPAALSTFAAITNMASASVLSTSSSATFGK